MSGAGDSASNAVGRDGPVDPKPDIEARAPFAGSRRRRRGGGKGADGAPVVPDATFTSYYGRPVVKESPWEADIPAYLFLGGLAAGSSLLAAGADLTDRPALRRTGRYGALVGIGVSLLALVHDLGKPSRFLNMLRVAKPTSPMSVGTWILSVFGPLVGLAAGGELAGPLRRFVPLRLRPLLGIVEFGARPAGLAAAVVAPAVASYTAVLLADTATPTWNTARRELPFVFVGSAAAASGGLGMIGAPVAQAGPARRLALVGAVAELAASQVMQRSLGITAEPLHEGTPGRLHRASTALTATGAVLTVVARRSRAAGVAAGVSLLAGSVCTRFAIFEAGQASARDPKYTVVPQRERLERGRRA